MHIIKVGGVPEHFNGPWRLAIEENKFGDDLQVEWTDYPGGTGDMCKALSNKDVDVAIMLTEGSLVHALKDPKVKLLGVYVSTSAIWGIHAGADSCKFDDIKDMKGKATFAISRFNSGSHLMAYVLAESLGWDTKSEAEVNFKVVGGLKGAIEELPKDGSLVFMWEKFTTMPWVGEGQPFKRVGEFPTPWPFFVIAVNQDFLAEDHARDSLRKVLEVVKQRAVEFKNEGRPDEKTLEFIKKQYKIEPENAKEWIKTVDWAVSPDIDVTMLLKVGETLHRLGKIESDNAPTSEEIENAIALIDEIPSKRRKEQ